MQKPKEITYEMLASGNKRFGNFIIDSIVAGLIQVGVAAGLNSLYDIYGYEGLQIGAPVMGNLKFTMLALGINIIYYGLSESLLLRTPAKFITNTMVLNRDGSEPGNGRIFARTLCRLIPLEFITFLGARPVGLHDGLSKTVVVDIYQYKRASPERTKEDNTLENNENEQG